MSLPRASQQESSKWIPASNSLADGIEPVMMGLESPAMTVDAQLPPTSPPGTIAQRLRELSGLFSQTEISRRTGIPRSTITWYIAGRKIPASLCAKLIREFGVNATWLMFGRGDPYYNLATKAQMELLIPILKR